MLQSSYEIYENYLVNIEFTKLINPKHIYWQEYDMMKMNSNKLKWKH